MQGDDQRHGEKVRQIVLGVVGVTTRAHTSYEGIILESGRKKPVHMGIGLSSQRKFCRTAPYISRMFAIFQNLYVHNNKKFWASDPSQIQYYILSSNIPSSLSFVPLSQHFLRVR
jgi:hypothetical protein